jgi:hypothetical protein
MKKLVTTVCIGVRNVAFNDRPVLNKGCNLGPFTVRASMFFGVYSHNIIAICVCMAFSRPSAKGPSN